MEEIKNEVVDTEKKEVATVKKSFKEKLAERKQAKKDDKIRSLELKADLMKNPENPDERKAELKEIRKRQLKRAAVPVALGTGVVVGTIVTVAKAAGGNNDQDSSEDESPSED